MLSRGIKGQIGTPHRIGRKVSGWGRAKGLRKLQKTAKAPPDWRM